MNPTDEINALHGMRDRYREEMYHPNPEVRSEARRNLREVEREIRTWYARHYRNPAREERTA